MKPIAKYVNDGGSEGTRYAWKLDNNDIYVESGAFPRRTKLGEGTKDENIAAYTTSVSLGCLLQKMGKECAFCVTGNEIPYVRKLSSEEIALENVYMALDDARANELGLTREFAYMGQGEPGLSYDEVKGGILLTDKVMAELGVDVYRHIFATSGIPGAINRLGQDIADGNYLNDILLHLSIHAVGDRDSIMPVNELYPLSAVVDASNNYSALTGQKSVINLMLFKDAYLLGQGPFTTDKSTVQNLVKLINPDNHRVTLCEYNPDSRVGTNGEITEEFVGELEDVLDKEGFFVKKFIAFGRDNDLACGLLGGSAEPNLDSESIESTLIESKKLIENAK